MSDFTVCSYLREYNVHFSDDLRQELETEVLPSDFVLIDRRVLELHAEVFAPILEKVSFFAVLASEERKSYLGIEPIMENIIQSGFRRGNRLIAIGGGIIQDVTAFISSVLYRGVEWIFFPTTLLAQADSCIGSKTSINFGPYKNQLGGFYPPSKINICVSFLKSLPEGDLLSGLGEMCHYYLIAGEDDFKWFAQQFDAVCARDVVVLEEVTHRSLMVKKSMVEKDEFDRGERQIFNYGHSFGHALESLTNYRVPHGIGVAYGMDMANYVSEKMELLQPGMRVEVRTFLEKVWTLYPIADVTADKMIEALGKDKKNSGDRLGLILTRGYGDMFKQFVDKKTVADLLEEYFRSEIQ